MLEMNMKKIFFLTLGLFSFIFLLYAPSPALAHFFETDKTVTGELHVEPHDNPVPGEPATLYFHFVDSLKKFSLATCVCSLSILEGKETVFQTQLIPKKDKKLTLYDSSLLYSFPHKDTYNIVLQAEPKTIDAFEPFTITWDDFHVIQNPKPKPINFTQTLFLYFAYFLGSFVILGLLFFTALSVKKKIEGKKKNA